MSSTLSPPIASDTFNPTLGAGVTELSRDADIVFVQYIRHVMPLDGYVFRLRTKQTTIKGSLHHAANSQQREDESITISRVIFTTSEPISDFNEIAPSTIWIGEHAGLKFAFSQRGYFYATSGLYHYQGDAVYPVMETQLIDVGAQLSDRTLIVSNSLPAWLSLKDYSVPWLIAGNPGITLYPAFLVPDNLRPPYGTVYIPDESTRPMAGLPVIRGRGAHSQLVCENVNVTLYGTTNDEALAFLDLVNQYALDTEAFGMMSAAVAQDPKRIQNEINVIAMKKVFRFEVNYLQQAMPDVAMQMINKVIVNFLPQDQSHPIPH